MTYDPLPTTHRPLRMTWRHHRLLACLALAVATTTPAPAAEDSWIDKLKSIPGLSPAPGEERGPESKVGTIWVVPLAGGAAERWGKNADLRSPRFGLDGSLWALQGETVVHLPSRESDVVRSASIPGAIKLVGFTANGELVVLRDDPLRPLAALIPGKEKVIDVPPDPSGQTLTRIRGASWADANVIVSEQLQKKETIRRAIEWNDIVIQPRDGSTPRNVSNCDGTDCVQPAVDTRGGRVAFVKVKR